MMSLGREYEQTGNNCKAVGDDGEVYQSEKGGTEKESGHVYKKVKAKQKITF
jgi:hypothetical protein